MYAHPQRYICAFQCFQWKYKQHAISLYTATFLMFLILVSDLGVCEHGVFESFSHKAAH